MNEHLYRSRDDRVLAGVAGGLAEIWDADPSLIRIVWVLLAFLTGGLAVLVYVVMAVVVPEGDAIRDLPPAPSVDAAAAAPAAAASVAAEQPAVAGPAVAAAATPTQGTASDRRAARSAARRARRAARRERRGESSAGIVIGALLILVGGLFLVKEWLPAFDADLLWPLALVGLGVVILVVGFSRGSGTGTGSGGTAT